MHFFKKNVDICLLISGLHKGHNHSAQYLTGFSSQFLNTTPLIRAPCLYTLGHFDSILMLSLVCLCLGHADGNVCVEKGHLCMHTVQP